MCVVVAVLLVSNVSVVDDAHNREGENESRRIMDLECHRVSIRVCAISDEEDKGVLDTTKETMSDLKGGVQGAKVIIRCTLQGLSRHGTYTEHMMYTGSSVGVEYLCVNNFRIAEDTVTITDSAIEGFIKDGKFLKSGCYIINENKFICEVGKGVGWVGLVRLLGVGGIGWEGVERFGGVVGPIDEGLFRWKNLGTLAEGNEGALHLGPERARVYSDLSPEDKERYNADIRATNILLQGLPKDIYTLINHYTDAKDIWADNVKMLLEGSELTKEDRESQLYDDFEHFRQNKGETIHDYYVRGLRWTPIISVVYLKQREAHANENKMILERFTKPNVDPLALMSNVSHQQYYSQSSTTPPSTHGTRPMRYDADVDEQPVQDLALNMDNVFQADDCDAY
ncbi:hypothetical protein Tco_0790073 [Tanacetum coccineum]